MKLNFRAGKNSNELFKQKNSKDKKKEKCSKRILLALNDFVNETRMSGSLIRESFIKPEKMENPNGFSAFYDQ